MKTAVLLSIIILFSIDSSYSQQNNIAKRDKFSMAVTVGGYRAGDSITIDELKKKPKLIPDRDAFEIMSFTWGGSCIGGTFRTFDIVGNSFPQKHIALLGNVYFLLIDNIKAKNKVGQIVYLNSYNIKIVKKK